MPQSIVTPFWHPAQSGAFILDWDGVLADTRLNFLPLRQKYFGGKTVPLIEAAASLPEPLSTEVKSEICRIEMEGAKKATAVEGAHDLITWLNENKKPWAVVSRNCRDSILLAAEQSGIDLPLVVLSREDPHVKPAPEAMALAAKKLKIDLADCVMVGDFIYDLLGARRAAIRSVLVQRDGVEWANLADIAYPTVKEFVKSLSSPEPLVPWEYHDLVQERGTDYFTNVARRIYRMGNTATFSQALELARMGVIHLSVPNDLKIGIDDWKNSSLPAQTINMPLHVLLRDVMAAHWPCVEITATSEDLDEKNIEVPLLYGEELRDFILNSLQ